MKQAVDNCQDGRIVLIEENLTDNSKVYCIRVFAADGISYADINCINEEAAGDLFAKLSDQTFFIMDGG